MIIKIMVLSIESTAMKIFLEMYTWKLALTKSEVKHIRLQNCMFGIQRFKIILKESRRYTKMITKVTCRSWQYGRYIKYIIFHIFFIIYIFYPPRTRKKTFFKLAVIVLTSSINIFHPSSKSSAYIKSPTIIVRKGTSVPLLALEIHTPSPGRDSQPLHDDQKCPYRSRSSMFTFAKKTFKDSRLFIFLTQAFPF